MKTRDLINAIAQDAPATLPSIAGRMAAALASGGLLAVALFACMLGVRPDIAAALQTWRFDAKLVTTLLLFAVALWLAVRLARPDADLGRPLRALLLPLLALAVAMASELMASPPDTWSARAIGTNSRLCVASIVILSIAPLAALLLALRAGAPSSPTTAGAVAGLLAGGLAATLYAVHCIDDSPLFLALWYAPPVALVTVMGAAIGRRVLRW